MGNYKILLHLSGSALFLSVADGAIITTQISQVTWNIANNTETNNGMESGSPTIDDGSGGDRVESVTGSSAQDPTNLTFRTTNTFDNTQATLEFGNFDSIASNTAADAGSVTASGFTEIDFTAEAGDVLQFVGVSLLASVNAGVTGFAEVRITFDNVTTSTNLVDEAATQNTFGTSTPGQISNQTLIAGNLYRLRYSTIANAEYNPGSGFGGTVSADGPLVLNLINGTTWSVVPEPSTSALLTLCGLSLVTRRVRRTSQS